MRRKKRRRRKPRPMRETFKKPCLKPSLLILQSCPHVRGRPSASCRPTAVAALTPARTAPDSA